MAADSSDIRPEAHRLVDALPPTASWDDLAYEVYVRQSLDTGIADADSGRTMSADDALARIRSRIRRAS
jgi:predicted transcriptional regulator